MNQKEDILKGFFTFLEECPSYFHVIQAMEKRLVTAGFKKLSEKEDLSNVNDGKYFIIRNDMALAAFRKKEIQKDFALLEHIPIALHCV